MTYKIDCPIIVSKLLQHTQIKEQLLKLIEEMPTARIEHDNGLDDVISKTDWNLDDSDREKYLDLVKPILISHTVSEFKKFNSKGMAFGNFWFQQYNHLDTHEWHVHGKCHWTNVYFLELPDEHLKTQIQNFDRSALVDYQASEGDIISFPSFLYHKSPVNTTAFRKTIISFNTNYV